jgi:hypothetical protein
MRVLVLVAALSTILLGFVIGCAGLLALFLSEQADLLSTVTFAAAVITLTLGLGLALAWHAWRAARGYPSTSFNPTKMGLWILLYVIVLAIGQGVISLDLLPVVTFPPFHLAAAVLPAFVIVALVARGLKGTSTWRDLSLQVASGALISTSIAFILEAVVVLGFLGSTLLGVAMHPGGKELLLRLSAALDNPTWAQDPGLLVPALASPLLLAFAFTLFAGIVPIVEEAVKTVGVGLRAYRQPTMAQCYLWGLAGGAGFAVVEALLNTLGGLDGWSTMAALRAAATLLHCTTGGLMGLAWYYLLTSRRWGRVLGLYASSLAIHGFWNAVSASMTLISLRGISGEAASTGQLLAGLGVFTLLATLLGLALGMVIILAWLTPYVRRASLAEAAKQEILTRSFSLSSAEAGMAKDQIQLGGPRKIIDA